MMSWISELLGPSFATAGVNSSVTADSLRSSNVIGLYFSAHWCPPCRRFTPILAEFYQHRKKEDSGFEIVFISSDRDEAQWREYFSSMPWLAIPYQDRSRKGELSRKFEVQGIPTLVLLDSKTGEVITKTAVEKLYNDREGKNFPWIPEPLNKVIGDTFVSCDGKLVDRSTLDGKFLGLYFSASWCGPCKQFTPQLSRFYTSRAKDLNMEIIFVSADSNEQEFKEYSKKMPWISIQFDDKARRDDLNSMLDVQGIPMFVVLDKDHKTVINKDGRSALADDPEGTQFPWRARPVDEFCQRTALRLNEKAGMILFADGSDEKDALVDIFKKFGETRKSELAESDDKLDFYFSVNPSDPIVQRVKTLLKITPDDIICILDIPSGKYFKSNLPADKIDESALVNLLTDYSHGKLTFTPLGQ